MESIVYVPPPSVGGSRRADARLDLYRSEGRKQISASEYTVEIFPTIGIERVSCGVVIDDGDVVHIGKRRKAVER